MTMKGRRLSVVLAGVLLMGVLMALGITQATAQDNPNSQPSTSKVAADASGERLQSTTLKKVLWAVGQERRYSGAVKARLARPTLALATVYTGCSLIVTSGGVSTRPPSVSAPFKIQLQVLRLLVRLPWLHL
jgi:hypothetical protein